MRLDFSRIIDLSHKISNDMPIWPGDPSTHISQFKHEKYVVEEICMGSHTGTHMGTPFHFGFDKRVSDFDANALFVSSVVMDISAHGKGFVLKRNDVEKWEEKFGNVNVQAVLLRTGQSNLWDNPDMYFTNYGGFGVDAIDFLTKKGVKVFGTDAPGIDPWNDEEFLANCEIFKNGGVHLENLTNLDKLPLDRSFWIFIGALKINAGGSPARVVAFI
ncbi:cyclase family protein [Mesoaciditoga lauensis]|uniref:cyclase family protein n=1 Tax=Mesoaciditoga lauensis TaxID=1495039 RepID=UPI00056D9BE6|nr:cyclase family protein [Mesoaciditoga lauensis]